MLYWEYLEGLKTSSLWGVFNLRSVQGDLPLLTHPDLWVAARASPHLLGLGPLFYKVGNRRPCVGPMNLGALHRNPLSNQASNLS